MRETSYVIVGKPGKLGRNHKSVYTHLGIRELAGIDTLGEEVKVLE